MNLIDVLKESLSEVDFDSITTVTARSCRSFDHLIDEYHRDLTMTQSIIDCTALMCAVHLSIKMDGEPLWFYLVGAPSCGKSTLCELIGSDEINTKPLSKFTGLVSGSTQGNHLVPSMNQKCVIVKDGTLLLESSPQQLANVYGELRDIFDGSLEAHYRNGVEASFSGISFGMIIGITERVYSLDMAALGERFLHCRLETSRETELDRNQAAVHRVFNGTKLTNTEEGDQRSFPRQREHTAGFLMHIHNRVLQEDMLVPEYDEDTVADLQAFADVIACSRASAPKDAKERIMYESRPESSTRVVRQLAKLALCLCYVFDSTKIGDRILRLLHKVTLDTVHGRQYNIIREVALSDKGLSMAMAASRAGIPHETCVGVIKDLKSLSVINSDKETDRQGSGRRRNVLTCPAWIRNAFKRAEKYGERSEDVTHSETKTIERNPRPLRKRKRRKAKKESSDS